MKHGFTLQFQHISARLNEFKLKHEIERKKTVFIKLRIFGAIFNQQKCNKIVNE